MAVTALLLSLVFCFPVLPLVAIVLAIVVLVRGRADSGRGLAIAALVIAPLALIPTVLLLTTGLLGEAKDEFMAGFEEELRGPEGERDANGRITATSQVGIDHLRIGDCVLRMQTVDDVEAGEAPVGEATAVPCTARHLGEVYDIFDLDDEDFETQDDLDLAAVTGCLPEFKAYVGVPYRRSKLEITYYAPTVDQVSFATDTVICIATSRFGLTTSMLKGSKR